MNTIANVSFFIIRKLAMVLLANAVALGIPLAMIAIHITDSTVVKDWFSSSQVYELIIEESVGLVEQETANAGSQNIDAILDANPSLDKQAVISSITDVIEPSDLQLQAEEAIDELYRWFEGEVDSPEFSITIQDKVPDLSPALKNELTSQLSNLPICQPSEVAANQDIISAICIPEGESVSGEVDEYIDSLLSGEGFLGDATFSASDIPDLDDATESVQGFYPIFKNIPFIAAGVFAISTLVIVLSAKSGVARGVRDVGVSLFGSSFFLAIGSFFLSRIDSLPDNFIGLDGGAARSEVEASHAIVEPLFITILHDVSSSIFIVAGVVFVVGLLLALAGWQLGRPRSKASHSTMLTEDDQPNHEKWDKPNA